MEIFILITILQAFIMVILGSSIKELHRRLEWLIFDVSEIYNAISNIIEKDDCNNCQ